MWPVGSDQIVPQRLQRPTIGLLIAEAGPTSYFIMRYETFNFRVALPMGLSDDDGHEVGSNHVGPHANYSAAVF